MRRFFHFFRYFSLLLVTPALGCYSFGQTAKPLLLNISPADHDNDDYILSPQNWGIIQHDDGRIFLGNTSGVLSWDGSEWEIVAGTEDRRFFKFAEDNKGRIFTGGLQDLGYIGADSMGKATFVSLKDKLPEEVRDFDLIFRVASDGDRVFFLGGPNLFCWDGKEFQVWQDKENFSRIFT